MIRFTHSCFVLISIMSLTKSVCADDAVIVIEDLIVRAIDQADVPAMQTGAILDIRVHEGASVAAGTILAQLDDRHARLEQQIASVNSAIAERKQMDATESSLAKKKLARQEHHAKQGEIDVQIASIQANNQLQVLASEKSEAAAENELNRAVDARKRYVDSVSQSEIDALRLAFERSKLETQQAVFQSKVDELSAQAETISASAQKIAVEEARIGIERAKHDKEVQSLEAELAAFQSDLARLTVDQYQVVAPFDATVVELLRQKGEWVRAGEPLMRLIRLSELRAEGYVDADFRDALLSNAKTRLRLVGESEREIQRDGLKVFVSPEIDPVNHQVRFWVEFANPKHDVLPGMRMEMQMILAGDQ
ncbi:efflux RND transporter periplasmic adaptor subunit [Novipirellula aureliae]|nr:HlyD family efflux transporter periplasmic adaptor subunit [Novipirellula aureliae]